MVTAQVSPTLSVSKASSPQSWSISTDASSSSSRPHHWQVPTTRAVETQLRSSITRHMVRTLLGPATPWLTRYPDRDGQRSEQRARTPLVLYDAQACVVNCG